MNPKRNLRGFGLLAAAQSTLIVLAMVLLWIFALPLPESKLGIIASAATGSVFAFATLLVFFLIFRFTGRFGQSLLADIERVKDLFRGCSWWQLAALAAIAGIGEELLFRGFLQIWLGQHVTAVVAIVAASIIFGLLHYLSHAYFISATLMSIVFGVGYYLSGSLLMVMMWHGVYDFIALMAIVKFPQWVGIKSA